jgi:hypothetical protein
VSEAARPPFDRWLAASRWEPDSVSIGHLVSSLAPNGRPDPWATTEVVVAGLSLAQQKYLSVDQPARQPIRPAIPGVEGFEA